jgi:peptide/nickel transport system permease protein
MTMPAVTLARRTSPVLEFAREFLRSWSALLGLVLFVFLAGAALIGPFIAPQNPYDLMSLNLMDSRLLPGETGMAGYVHLLGTDDQGRDIFSAILYGLRISLGVGLGAGGIAAVLGTMVGLSAALIGGRTDTVMMRIVDFQLSFPAILVALVLLAALGPGIDKVIIALVTVQWAYFARTARSAALVERERDYIAAARSLGLSSRRILFRHLLPNCMPAVMVVAAVQIASAILLEATLSFLGLGLSVTQPSLGMLISNGFQHILSGRYWMTVFPGIALVLVVLSINLMGDRIRELLNPRQTP